MVPTRKTKLMKRVEAQRQQPLSELLPELINQLGQSAAADHLGISKATLGYWCMHEGVRVERIALRPGESIQIVKTLTNGHQP